MVRGFINLKRTFIIKDDKVICQNETVDYIISYFNREKQNIETMEMILDTYGKPEDVIYKISNTECYQFIEKYSKVKKPAAKLCDNYGKDLGLINIRVKYKELKSLIEETENYIQNNIVSKVMK